MKLAIIISHPIQHFCPQYASYAQIENLDVKVFFASSLGMQTYFDPNFKQEIKWGNLQLEKFNHQFLNDKKNLKSTPNLDAPELGENLREFGPDMVIVYGYFQKYQRRAYDWAKKNGVSIAYISDSEVKQKRPVWKKVLKWPFLRKYFRSVDYFLSVGNSNEDYYRYYGVPENKIRRNCFPIDITAYKSAFEHRGELRDNKRKELEIRESEIVLSSVGKLVSWKSQIDVVKTLSILEEEYPDQTYVYVVAGTGPDMEIIQKEAKKLKKNRVILAGFVKPEELPAIYASTDIYVHPAKIEPHSLAISEAIYMSCPIIISDRCGSYGVHDDVTENENGLVYKWNDLNDLSSKIKKLSKDRDLRLAFSKRSHEKSVEFQNLAHGETIRSIMKEYNSKS